MVESRPTERYCPKCHEVTQSLICRNDGYATVARGGPVVVGPAQREGETLEGRFRLEQLVHEDAAGARYRAMDLRVSAPVEVHLLPAGLYADLALVARFQREAPLIASLTHPHIQRVVDWGVTHDGLLFFASEPVLGPTLSEVVAREGALEPRRVADIGVAMLSALAYAHGHGVLHRSLTLDNVVLVRDGRGETVKVTQLGLARILCHDEVQPFVWPSALVGAWRTMAPEQARGRGVTGHADVYSVGAILYELLTGRPVFSETAPSDLLVSHSVKIPKPPERDGRMLVGPLVDQILRCLEKKPWNRPDGAKRALELFEVAREKPLAMSGISTAEFGAPATAQRPRTTTAGPGRGKAMRSVATLSPPPMPPEASTRESERPTRERSRATNPYTLPPTPPPATSVAYPSSRPADRPTVIEMPPTPASRRVTEPRPPHAAPLATGGGLNRPIMRAATEAPTVPELDATDTSDPELVIRGGPSPVVAFLLGLAAAGLLAGVGYLLLFGGDGAAEEEGVAGADAMAAVDVGPDVVEDTVLAERDVPAVDAASVVAAMAQTDVAVAADIPDIVRVSDAVAPGTPDTADIAGTSDVAVAAAVADVAKPARVDANTSPAEAPRPKPKPRPEVPVDPLADLEDPDFVNRPTPPTLRKVLVDSEPGGAKVSLGGRIIGETPMYVEWPEGEGGVDVVVTKVGYGPVRTRLSAGVGRAVKLRLEPSE